METHLWMILGIVTLVAVVGVVTVLPAGGPDVAQGDGLTANVIYAQEREIDCGACSGSPVCAAKGDTAFNYENACKAQCDGARILYDSVCERIPRAQQ